MKVINKYPWFWFFIKWFYPNVDLNKSAMCWGKHIYTFMQLTPEQIEHEEVHSIYQGKFVLFYFLRYTFFKKFRRRMEYEAYYVQFKGDIARVEKALQHPIYKL